MKAKVAAVYLRCSTKSQETEMQESEITDFCSRRGWEYKIYRDTGQSGAKESRPALDSLLSDVRKRRVDILVVWALDRLARSLKTLPQVLELPPPIRARLRLRVQRRGYFLDVLDVAAQRLLFRPDGVQAAVDAVGESAELLLREPPFFSSKFRWIDSRTSPNASAIRKPGG